MNWNLKSIVMSFSCLALLVGCGDDDDNKNPTTKAAAATKVDEQTGVTTYGGDLQETHKNFARDNSIVLVQPMCGTADFPCEINFDGNMDPSDNAQNVEQLSQNKKRAFYYDYIESGEGVLLSFMPYRAVSKDEATGQDKHVNDTESVFVAFKKEEGNSYIDKENLKTAKLSSVVANAHGAQLVADGEAVTEQVKSIVHAQGLEQKVQQQLQQAQQAAAKNKAEGAAEKMNEQLEQLKGMAQLFLTQTKDPNDRKAALVGGTHPVVLSAPRSHALSPVTKLQSLNAVNNGQTVVFFTEGTNVDELKKDDILSKAQFVQVDLIEFAPFLLKNRDKLLDDAADKVAKNTQTASVGWNGEALEPIDISTALKRGAKEEKAEANIDWGIAANSEEAQQAAAKGKLKDEGKGAVRYSLMAQDELMTQSLGITADSKSAKGRHVVRNPYLQKKDPSKAEKAVEKTQQATDAVKQDVKDAGADVKAVASDAADTAKDAGKAGAQKAKQVGKAATAPTTATTQP